MNSHSVVKAKTKPKPKKIINVKKIPLENLQGFNKVIVKMLNNTPPPKRLVRKSSASKLKPPIKPPIKPSIKSPIKLVRKPVRSPGPKKRPGKPFKATTGIKINTKQSQGAFKYLNKKQLSAKMKRITNNKKLL